MDRPTALQLLVDGNPRQRLEAARYLEVSAQSDDYSSIARALTNESVSWVQVSLRRALARVQGDAGVPTAEAEQSADVDIEDIYAEAIEETTGRIVHELEPIVGALRYYAQQEVQDFEESNTRQELERLRRLLQAIETLGLTAGAPKIQTFVLGDLVRQETAAWTAEQRVTFAGPDAMLVSGDPSLIGVIIRNAVANATEATAELGSQVGERVVVVTWGETDLDYWITVLDGGGGLPARAAHLFQMGATTKPGHLGMGLALSLRAAQSLHGSIDLSRREEGGTRLDFRWPKPQSERA